MKIRLKLLLFILFFVLLYAAYYWGVPAVVDIGHRVPEIQRIVKKELGTQIELKNPSLKMGLTPSIWLNASDFKIVDKNSTPLSVSNSKLKIRLLPLLFGKIQLAYFSCDKINLDLKIDKNFRFYIGNHLIIKSANSKFSIEDSKMNIESYKINLKDEIQNKDVLINGDYFDLEKYNSKKYIKFSTNSKLKIKNHYSIINADVDFRLPFKKGFDTNEVVFDGAVTNLSLADLSPYIRKISKNKIKKIDGILNIEADTKILNKKTTRIMTQMAVEKFSIEAKDSPNNNHFNNKFNITTIVDASKNVLIIKTFKILSNNIDADINGKINKISSQNPVLDLSVVLNKSRTEDFISLLPAKNSEEIGMNFIALKKYEYFSDLQGKLFIKGKIKKPKLTGKFLSTNGYLIKPFGGNIPKSTLKIDFLGENFDMDVIFPTSRNERILLKGKIDLYGGSKIHLDITSTPNVDLELTESILNPLHEIFNFALGPLPVMKLKGAGNINLKINGTRENSHLFGVFNFRNTTASFNGINMLLKNGEGSLEFKDKDTHLVTKKAFLDNKLVKIDGKCSFFGVLDYDITASNQNWDKLLDVVKTSPLLGDIQKLIPAKSNIKGKFNTKLKLKGKVQDINEFALGKTVFLEGNIKLLGNDVLFNQMHTSIKNLFGTVNFKNTDADFDLYSLLDNSKIYIKGKLKNKNVNLEMKGSLKNNPFNLTCDIKNIFQKKQIINAKFISENFDLSELKNLVQYPFIPQNVKKYLNEISNSSGHVSLKASIKNNVVNSKIKLNEIAFAYSNIPIKIFSGNIELNDDKLILYKVNANLDSMPILVDGFITNIFENPQFNLYLNSKLSQNFVEKYINKNAVYPLKIKGDIIYSARINGNKNFFNAKTELNLQEDSNISYMGSIVGDVNNPIKIFADTNISKNSIYVNNFQYDKLISSQNDKQFVSPQLNARGRIDVSKNDIVFHNFRVKTQNPTDAKIFNLLFKKSMIKQGLFTSNVIINDSIVSPKLSGFLNFTGVDIPFVDTIIKDISLDFGAKDIEIKSKGEIFSNKITLFANAENRLVAPYVFNDVDIYLGNLDINEISKSLRKLDLDSDKRNLIDEKSGVAGGSIANVVIKKAKVKADSVFVRNIFAKNLLADFSLNEKLLFSVNNFSFDVAEGSVNGNFKYNLLNSNSALELHVDKVNANSMAEALFDLPNQIFGSLIGEAELVCNGKTHKTCMDTLSGSGGFRVVDGKMPKLGSLEYLLKSANLVKSGITGLTINSLIELVTPLKTGQFENINGNFLIKSGIANDIQIFSKGNDLSLFLTGTYNFSRLVADMKVFGRISKKISNVLGPIGNTSLNTLFNTIPGLNLAEENNAEFVKNLNKIPGFELNDKSYRIFSAEIYGDINGENYVQSFKWIE